MPSTRLKRLQDDWPLLTYYQKFESIVALILTLIIGLIIWLIGLLPIQQPFKSIAYAVVVIILILWLAQNFGLMGPVLR